VIFYKYCCYYVANIYKKLTQLERIKSKLKCVSYELNKFLDYFYIRNKVFHIYISILDHHWMVSINY
jgi:hypothetical protein